MNRILFDVSRWHLLLHREHRQMPVAKDADSHLLKLEDELFERLYAGECDRVPAERTNAGLRP